MNKGKIKRTLSEALRAAGTILENSLDERNIVERKSELSLVTATDKKAEAAILEVIRSTFPDHAFLTEESPPMGDSGNRWIIDPVDGTTNFAHTYPVAGVSIAFESDGTLEVGGVYDPFRKELFFATRGEGAFLNDKPISVSKTPSLKEALIATGFPYDRRERLDQYLTIVKDFLMEIHGVRRSGAAAIDLCYVACGRLDGFWEFQLQPWDKAAAMLIIKEAGGKTTDYKNQPMTIHSTQNVASNGLIHGDMIRVLKPYQHLTK